MNLPECMDAVAIQPAEYLRVALPPLVGHRCFHSFRGQDLVLDLSPPGERIWARARLVLRARWELRILGEMLAARPSGVAEVQGAEGDDPDGSPPLPLPFLARVTAISIGLREPGLRVGFDNGMWILCPASPEGSPGFSLDFPPDEAGDPPGP